MVVVAQENHTCLGGTREPVSVKRGLAFKMPTPRTHLKMAKTKKNLSLLYLAGKILVGVTKPGFLLQARLPLPGLLCSKDTLESLTLPGSDCAPRAEPPSVVVWGCEGR